MSTQISLPVYKSTYDLFLESFRLIKDLRKDYKYTVGEKIKNETMDLMMNIYKANKGNKKKQRVEKAKENIEIVRILFRVLKDLKEISIDNFARANKQIEDVSKQLTGWQKSLN